MTQERTYSIKCPKCGAEQSVELYDAINVAESPLLKDELLSNRINAVVCDECGFDFRVDKSLLYHDPELGVLIYLLPENGYSEAEGEAEFVRSIEILNSSLPDSVSSPEVHLVGRREELIERIFLLEDGLDERIIEYIKYMVYSKNMEQVNPLTKTLLFNVQDSDDENLCFVIQDVETRQLEGMLQYNRDAYVAFEEMFDEDEQTATLLEMFPGPFISARRLVLKDAQPGSSGSAA
ncbi:MAG: CpXC domain-containing protein [Verrucomicrobia bacterium]|nr:CpXC domain-containing protein [Verrucomicrobiota bacterium]